MTTKKYSEGDVRLYYSGSILKIDVRFMLIVQFAIGNSLLRRALPKPNSSPLLAGYGRSYCPRPRAAPGATPGAAPGPRPRQPHPHHQAVLERRRADPQGPGPDTPHQACVADIQHRDTVLQEEGRLQESRQTAADALHHCHEYERYSVQVNGEVFIMEKLTGYGA